MLTVIAGAGSTHPSSASPPEPVRIPQAWASRGVDDASTDSLAVWTDRHGQVTLFATAKAGGRVDVFDATTGDFVRSIGQPGKGPGEFAYPNGITVVHFARPHGFAKHDSAALAGLNDENPTPQDRASSDLVLVVERDNARVQAFHPENGEFVGAFGQNDLYRPYGIAVSYPASSPRVYVTDTQSPRGEQVNVFELGYNANGITGKLVNRFGDANGPGTIEEIESILIDDRYDRVFICDEDSSAHHVKVYTRNGRFAGATVGDGLIRHEPEGLALLPGPRSGYLIVTDQGHARTVWHVFDRATLAYRFSFTGDPTIANTDGICVHPIPFAGFDRGGLFAVNNDRDIRAYRLESIRAVAPARH